MIVIALGANLPSPVGEPRETMEAALAMLEARGVRTLRVSSFYKTIAWPNPSDPPFLNAVACVASALSPRELLKNLHQVETSFGRKRSEKNAPRSLDLDLLDYEGRVEVGPPALPHPRMESRNFVLVPLSEIAPGWRHPTSGRTVEELIAALPEEARTAIRRNG